MRDEDIPHGRHRFVFQHLKKDDGGSGGRTVAHVKWDEVETRPLAEDMLDDLQLGFATTVHKAQGSQWPRVNVPSTGHRLLDRTLIYTAVTRAQSQVILVGDSDAVRESVLAEPKARSRQVSLDLMLNSLLDGATSS